MITDPANVVPGTARVLRGGSWYYFGWNCRSAFRFWSEPDYRFNYCGFRLAAAQREQIAASKFHSDLEMMVCAVHQDPGDILAYEALMDELEFVGKERRLVLGGDSGIDLVLIPPGTFEMGSVDGDSDEKPVVPVKISKAFYLGRTSVTQEQYSAVMRANPSAFRQIDGCDTRNFPVESVSWEDAQEFIVRLNKQNDLPPGWMYCLPTEAQWEYACRAGTKSAYHLGDTLTPKEANFYESGLRRTCPVGAYPANAFGLHDMHGNVWEWCQDWYDANWYKKLAASLEAKV